MEYDAINMSERQVQIGNGFSCPSCGAAPMQMFHRVKSVPVNSCILMQSPEEAINYPKGDINLGFCEACGFISNTAFDEVLTEYSGRYEETQGFSSTFKAFHTDLARRLIERYDLHGKDVIEIGCGKGEFLNLLCKLGENQGLGFDPGYLEARDQGEAGAAIKFIQDFYSEKYASHHGDFICCKMTLEHIHATRDFVGVVRRAIGAETQTIVFFQVPEATRIVRDCAFEDIYYEHCSYFTPGSLAELFGRCGFDVLDVSTEYDDQYLTVEATPINGTDRQVKFAAVRDHEALSRYVAAFPEKYRQKRHAWDERLRGFRAERRRTVLWGSGSKAVAFLTTSEEQHAIKHVVDINPYRQGYFMPGTGQEIVSPDFLKEYRPDVVIVMNGIYCGEINSQLRRMDLDPLILAL